MNSRQIFLIIAALGLVPIALSYGLVPEKSLGYLFQMSVSDINTTHIFRAIMGLYLALATFWITGAIKPDLRQAALYSLVVFMLGLAFGRLLSLVIDGSPNILLLLYLFLELGFGVAGIVLLRREQDAVFRDDV
jgi:hypothetical protein